MSKQADGMIALEGGISGDFPGDTLIHLKDPIRLDLSGIHVVNSIGVREFIQFMITCQGRNIEFHNLSNAFLDAINIFAAMLGSPPRPEVVKSLVQNMYCRLCDKEYRMTIQLHSHEYREAVKAVPMVKCNGCQKPLKLAEDPQDLFCFLIR